MSCLDVCLRTMSSLPLSPSSFHASPCLPTGHRSATSPAPAPTSRALVLVYKWQATIWLLDIIDPHPFTATAIKPSKTATHSRPLHFHVLLPRFIYIYSASAYIPSLAAFLHLRLSKSPSVFVRVHCFLWFFSRSTSSHLSSPAFLTKTGTAWYMASLV